MANLLSTFQKLKEQVSPMAVVADSNQNASTEPAKKLYTSEDDPFNDKREKQRIALTPKQDSNSRDTTKSIASPFIKNDNLSKEMRKSAEPEYVQVEYQQIVKPTIEDDQKDKVKKVKHPRSEKNVEEEEDEVSLSVLEEMNKLEECFPVLSSNYRLIDKIGEGTFSTVYKAEALNGTVRLSSDIWKSPPLKKQKGNNKKSKTKSKNPIVALKQIYVTSSPNRIYNELNLLYILTGNSHIAPLLDVLRYQDQVLAILPFYPHTDFRDFYRDLPIKGIKRYLSEMFQGLEFVHNKGVIHRDLKPTNFLYDPFKGKGVLVDFGLAEKVNTNQFSKANSQNSNQCPCNARDKFSKTRVHYNISNKRLNIKAAYPKQDQRPPRRANRAGTRGFRAPEVLFKCTNQSTKIDIWSAGIIGLSLFARKFPLFNSPDDTDALVELSIVFGLDKLTRCSELHGCGLEINLTNKYQSNGNIIKLIADSLLYEAEQNALPSDSVIYDTIKVLNEKGDGFNDELQKFSTSTSPQELQLFEIYKDHKDLYELLLGCFHMDPSKRLSAKEILSLPYFDELLETSDDDVILE